MRLVIAGGEAAGLSAASRARRLDPSMEIVVLEKTSHISYGACGLPYYIGGQVRSLQQLRVLSAERLEKERNIRVRTQCEVVSISHPRREVTLRNGEKIHYDKLVLATGARRDLSSLEGWQDPRVLPMDTWDESEKLKNFLRDRKPRTAVIIGGGYIALEAAEALRTQGLQVEIHEKHKDVLGRHDPWLTSIVVKQLERYHVALHRESTLKSIPDADLIIAAFGMKPNVTLAQDAGIELGRTGAIRVTERMETNLHGVYAAGDCAESMHLVSGRPVWIPLGTTANKMGRVAGACATGARERFAGIVGTSIVRVCGLGVATTGLSSALAKTEGFDPVEVTIEAMDKPGYFRGHKTSVQLVADRRTGRLVGGSVVGEDNVAGRINVLATALHQRTLVEEFAMFDLAYSPPYATVWDPLLIAAHELIKLLH